MNILNQIIWMVIFWRWFWTFLIRHPLLDQRVANGVIKSSANISGMAVDLKDWKNISQKEFIENFQNAKRLFNEVETYFLHCPKVGRQSFFTKRNTKCRSSGLRNGEVASNIADRYQIFISIFFKKKFNQFKRKKDNNWSRSHANDRVWTDKNKVSMDLYWNGLNHFSPI